MSLADHLHALSDAVEQLEDAGVEIEEVEGFAQYNHRDDLLVTLQLGIPATLDESATEDADGGETLAEIEADLEEKIQRLKQTDDEAQETTAEVDTDTEAPDAGDESAAEIEGDTEDTDDDAPETRCVDGDHLATVVARDYGLSLTGDVLDHVDADRVTVVDQPHGADLVPGTDAEGPDYAVGETKIQLGVPGVDAIGVEPDDEVHVSWDDGVRLEAAGGESAAETESDRDNDAGDDADNEGHDQEGGGDQDDSDGGDPGGGGRDNDDGDAPDGDQGEDVDEADAADDGPGDRSDGESADNADASEQARANHDGNRCGECDIAFPGKLQHLIHRTEVHGVQKVQFGNLEAGEFREIVEDSESVQAVADELDWSTERVMRALGLYGLEHLVTPDDINGGESAFESVSPDWLDEGTFWTAVEESRTLRELIDQLGAEDRAAVAQLVAATGAADDLETRQEATV